MKLKDIASVAGKSGLYRVLKPTRSGMIVVTLDASSKKTVMNATHRVSILQEISIYTTGAEESVDLGVVLKSVHEKYKGKEAKVEKDSESLATFMAGVLSNYDAERVYTSDIKKLAAWYNILIQFAPDAFEEEEKKEEEPKAEEVKEESKAEEKKPAEKKAPAKKKAVKKEEDEPVAEKAPAKKKKAAPKAKVEKSKD
ncbi:MAG: hypothetical protein ACI85I_000234 [Arenicella sp.]|jgi:hypothetical protein